MNVKKNFKRLFSAAVSAVLMFGTSGPIHQTGLIKPIEANAYTANDVLAQARSHRNDNTWSGFCLQFVQDMFQAAGCNAERLDAARDARDRWQTHTDRDIPAGACVFFDNEFGIEYWDSRNGEFGYWGHIEISAGGGRIIGSGSGSIQERDMNSYYWSHYTGWGWYNGVAPDSENQQPIGWLDAVEGGDGKLYVKGWTFDPDEPAKQLFVHIYVGGSSGSGASSYAITADKKRQDVDDAYHCGAYHGFEETIYIAESGEQPVYAYAIDAQGGNNPELSGCPLNATISPDDEEPVISNVEVSDVSSTGYTVTCNVSDNIAIQKVQFPTWTLNDGQDDLIWHNGTIKDGKATFRLDVKNHQKQSGCVYRTHIYAYDYAGNKTVAHVEDQTLPSPISNIRVSNIDKTGYDITCDVDANWGLTKIEFPTWTMLEGQDDLLWKEGMLEDGTATFRVSASDHNNETGLYRTHIYLWDDSDGEHRYCAAIAVPDVYVGIQGDIDNDGEVTLADAERLQRYLLCMPKIKLPIWQAGDLNYDGTLNAIDLSLLKKEIVDAT